MDPTKKFPYRCDNCRYWRFSRTDKAHVCVNPESSYYGENMDAGKCCRSYSKKEEKK